ncbi:hypothetical protein BT96DRAFT_817352 [Gymnopus androsaceus JB14]|uniref:Uncharacterized protein n=1 Tax=Gymnopus androsaceus JB14 TaxID=1447944 RepID=A0A6A4HVI4_9AGAR|nr:hypothetical protein BT96DRAFT_817352 [Gymnopus androsaceus JB14]
MIFSVILSLVIGAFVRASPFPQPTSASFGVNSLSLKHRTVEPTFPSSPSSCPICQQNYSSIQNCAEASPVLANFTEIIFNPGAFINIIECACTETFQSVFPQCVDCFEQTNQTDVLAAPDLDSVVQGMRNICALESTLLGGAASADGEVSSTSSAAIATSTASTSSQPRDMVLSMTWMYMISAVMTIAGFSHVLL